MRPPPLPVLPCTRAHTHTHTHTHAPLQAGFLETQNRMLMERLVTAEERAQGAEREVEQLRDQIKTINFGDMLQEVGGLVVLFFYFR